MLVLLQFHVSGEALKVFQTAPEDRTEKDVKVIYNLTRNIPTFRRYTEKMQLLMCQIAAYVK